MEVTPGGVLTILSLLLLFGGGSAWVARADMEHTIYKQDIKEIVDILAQTVKTQRDIEKILDRQVTLDEERARVNREKVAGTDVDPPGEEDR